MIQQSPSEERADARYLIRKGGAYYRPDAAGYTRCKHEAGRYTLAEAIRHSHPNGPDGPRDGIDYVPDDEPQAGQPAEADGWVMVPREPTQNMIEAVVHLDFTSRTDPTWPEYWSAMLAATPKAPTSTDAGEVLTRKTIAKALHETAKKYGDLEPFAPPFLNEFADAVLALATPPAPNDELRAALERAGQAERNLQELQAAFVECVGIMLKHAPAHEQASFLAALKENRRG